MKFNRITYNLSLTVIIIFAIYTLIYSGLAGLLLCSSVALITAAFVDTFEIVVALTVIFGLIYIFFLRKFFRRFEAFQNEDTPKKIISRVESMSKHKEPQGVYNPKIEGFQDVQPEDKKEGESSESSKAPNKRNDEVKLPTEDATEAIKSATGNLFKLGQVPSESKEGPHMDAGSTLLKAMESFKPDQISAMTSDTKKLIETQKGLMEMLNNMRPVLQDGKQLLDTFSGMFGGGGGAFKL